MPHPDAYDLVCNTQKTRVRGEGKYEKEFGVTPCKQIANML